MNGHALQWLHAGAACERERYGLKAHGLARLVNAGFDVPRGFALTAEQVLAVARGEAREELETALQTLAVSCGPVHVAVRASPTLDLPGALPTFLDVAPELEAVRAAISAIAAAEQSASVRDQRAARALPPSAGAWIGVVVQELVHARGASEFGAVVCSCDPQTGGALVVGELAFGLGPHAVVSGRTRPLSLPEAAHEADEAMRLRITALSGLAQRVEASFGEPVEIELLACTDRTWLLEARPLTLSPAATLQRALDAVDGDDPAFGRRLAEVAERVLPLVAFDGPVAPAGAAILRGLCACAGGGAGVAVFDAERAVARAVQEPVVLVRDAAEPSDVAGFRAARAVLTTTGGITCHAAVIARSVNVPALVSVCGTGANAARSGAVIAPDGRSLLDARGGSVIVREGDHVFVDAARGLVYAGEGASVPPWHASLARLYGEIRKLRPRPVWVEGELEAAMTVREACLLDGVLVRGPREAALRCPRRGREVYWCVSADEPLAELASLPAGFGIVFEGPVALLHLREARTTLRGRSLGALTRRAHAPSLRDAGLDLLIIDAAGESASDIGPGELEALQAVAPRLMWRAGPPPRTGHIGVIVPAHTAAAIALLQTGERPARSPSAE